MMLTRICLLILLALPALADTGKPVPRVATLEVVKGSKEKIATEKAEKAKKEREEKLKESKKAE